MPAPSPIIHFEGHTYEIMLSPLSWSSAQAVALYSGGYLAQVTSADENQAIFNLAMEQYTYYQEFYTAADGGGSVYVWLGGSDASQEGVWQWTDGTLISGYANWGSGGGVTEPDNYNGMQDHLGLALEQWPYATGSIGAAGEWNDVNGSNSLWYVVEFDGLYGTAGSDRIDGSSLDEYLSGGLGDDTLYGQDGSDTLLGGDGNDLLMGGVTGNDLRDVIYGGNGNDSADGGYGNDELRGDAGNDTLIGSYGADTVIGGADDDVLTAQAWGDLLYGGDGNDFINGGYGYDRANGGDGADRFYHLGVAGHGSDWIQDYDATEGDVLVFGGTGTNDQFQVNFVETANAGAAGVEEAFVIYRPTGQILWALVDGGAQSEINMVMGGVTYDLLA